MAFEVYIRSGQKQLRCGYTTGTCAALAAAGAARMLLQGSCPEQLSLVTPKGIPVTVQPLRCTGDEAMAECAVVKDAGDGFDSSVDYAALNGQKISVAASPTPHADILKIAKNILAKKGITLEILEFTDYVQPNNVVDSGDVDANYFQHLPYLQDFNEKQGTHLVSILSVHVEPMGFYGGKQKTLDALKK